MKRCCHCKQLKSKNEFNKNISKKDKLDSACKDCRKIISHKSYLNNIRKVSNRSKIWRKNNPEKTKIKDRRNNLKKNYNLLLDDYNKLADKQDNRCAICGRTAEVLYIDHDHKCCNSRKSCGKCIRGLLCHACNTLLGSAADNIEILLNAIQYLQKYQENL